MATDRSLINVGSIIEDNDPRMKGRHLVIKSFAQGMPTAHGHDVFAVCDSPWRNVRQVRINVSRIHTDGKSRRSGFSLLAGSAPEGR